MQVHVTNIEWDTECDDDSGTPDLPESMMIALELQDGDDLVEVIATCLSDQTGFCVQGFDHKTYCRRRQKSS
jgi:hypothetical protein